MPQSKLGEVRGIYKTEDVEYGGTIAAGDFVSINDHDGSIPKVVRQSSGSEVFGVALRAGKNGDRAPICCEGKIVVNYDVVTTSFGQSARVKDNKVVPETTTGSSPYAGFVWTGTTANGDAAIFNLKPTPGAHKTA